MQDAFFDAGTPSLIWIAQVRKLNILSCAETGTGSSLPLWFCSHTGTFPASQRQLVAVAPLFAAVSFVGAHLLESYLNGPAENWLIICRLMEIVCILMLNT